MMHTLVQNTKFLSLKFLCLDKTHLRLGRVYGDVMFKELMMRIVWISDCNPGIHPYFVFYSESRVPTYINAVSKPRIHNFESRNPN